MTEKPPGTLQERIRAVANGRSTYSRFGDKVRVPRFTLRDWAQELDVLREEVRHFYDIALEIQRSASPRTGDSGDLYQQGREDAIVDLLDAAFGSGGEPRLPHLYDVVHSS